MRNHEKVPSVISYSAEENEMQAVGLGLEQERHCNDTH